MSADLALAYLRAFDTGDPAAIAVFVTDDFVNEHTAALGGGCVGKEAYLERLPVFLRNFAGVHYEPESPLADGDRVAVPYRMSCRYDGHDVSIRGLFVFTFRGDLIAHRVDYWDSLSFLRQIGQSAE